MDPLAAPDTLPVDGEAVTARLDGALTALHDRLCTLRSAAARLIRAGEERELVALRTRLPALPEVLAAAVEAADDARRALEATPPGATLGPGYPAALEGEFRRLGLAFEGEFPDYEIFPLTVRVNPAAETVRIGRRTLQALDARAVARAVQREHRRLYTSSFNVGRFFDALSLCYDALSGGDLGATVPLLDVYRLLSARTGSAGYTRQEFGFDIYRLRRQADQLAKPRQIEFSHGKSGQRFPVPRVQGGTELFGAMVMRRVAGGA